MVIIMLGAPGTGKGTIASILTEKLGIPQVSTGDIFRKNIKEGNELGKLAEKYISKGQLVPDDVTIEIVEERLKQKDVEFRGYSMECRINAENPSKNFMPCPGTITGLNLPGGNGVRIDTAIYEGYTIPPTYDSMIAKIITHGDSRNEAISKMKRALEETVIEGVDTNIDFLFKIIKNPNFIRGNFDTSFIEKEILKK